MWAKSVPRVGEGEIGLVTNCYVFRYTLTPADFASRSAELAGELPDSYPQTLMTAGLKALNSIDHDRDRDRVVMDVENVA